MLCGLAPSTLFLVGRARLPIRRRGDDVSNILADPDQVYSRRAQRGKAVGIQATTVYLGLATGAPLGGRLTDTLGWRSVFYPHPVRADGAAARHGVSSATTSQSSRERFDLVGAGVYVLGLVALLLALNRGHMGLDLAADARVRGCGVVGAGALGRHRARGPSPMLDSRCSSGARSRRPVVSALLNYASAAQPTFLLPFALIQGRGLGPAQAGWSLTSQPIMMAATASFSGTLSDRIGSRMPATLGMAMLAVGLFLLSRMDARPRRSP